MDVSSSPCIFMFCFLDFKAWFLSTLFSSFYHRIFLGVIYCFSTWILKKAFLISSAPGGVQDGAGKPCERLSPALSLSSDGHVLRSHSADFPPSGPPTPPARFKTDLSCHWIRKYLIICLLGVKIFLKTKPRSHYSAWSIRIESFPRSSDFFICDF